MRRAIADAPMKAVVIVLLDPTPDGCPRRDGQELRGKTGNQPKSGIELAAGVL